MKSADTVWNRAALEGGGDSLGRGDRALASLPRLHGLIMNGGGHHALECIEPADVIAAADGYAFFGFNDARRSSVGRLVTHYLLLGPTTQK